MLAAFNGLRKQFEEHSLRFPDLRHVYAEYSRDDDSAIYELLKPANYRQQHSLPLPMGRLAPDFPRRLVGRDIVLQWGLESGSQFGRMATDMNVASKSSFGLSESSLVTLL